MALRKAGLAIAALLAVCVGDSPDGHNRWCERVCSRSRQECPAPCATIPPCPSHDVNLSCPEIPSCPSPVVNLTCPEVRCSCSTCLPPPPPPPCPACSPCPLCPACRTLEPNVLPAGYEVVPGVGIYKFFSSRKTWLNANRTCAADGGYLAIPDTRTELAFIVKIIKVQGTDAYVGFHDFNDEGNFRTSIGQPMSDFQKTLWYPDQPDGRSDQNGVFMTTDGLLVDYANGSVEEFVCEIPFP